MACRLVRRRIHYSLDGVMFSFCHLPVNSMMMMGLMLMLTGPWGARGEAESRKVYPLRTFTRLTSCCLPHLFTK